MKSQSAPFYSLLISFLGVLYLDSSWEVAYLKLEVELVIGLYHEAASLVAFLLKCFFFNGHDIT
jgi:hypothetical protein